MLKKRKFIFLSFLILGILLLTSCFLKPPPTEGILKGQVMVPEGSVQTKDLTGQVLPDATVNIINLTSGEIIATTTTDSNGTYQVFVPAGGPYLLEAVKDGIKLEQITCQVEVGIEYDLGTADCVTTAAALIAQTMIGAGTDPTDIDCAAIQADSNFNNVASIVCSTIQAGGDPTASAAIQEAIEDFLYPPAPTPAPTPTYTVTFNKNGGDTEADPTTKKAAHGGNVGTLPTEPTRTGYTFASWNTEANGSGTEFTATTAVTADITVYAQWASSDATLSDLTVDETTVTGFDRTTLDYNKELPYGTTTVPTVGVTTADPNASKVITQVTNVTGTEAQRTATVVVTAEDGTTQKIYTVTFSVAAASTDATLSDLSLSSGTLVPTFTSATISYTATVTNNITSITVTPTAADTNATITVNGTPVASGSASGAISLDVGENTITTIVTAQDGTTTKTYTVTVTRDASSAKAITAFDFKALDPEVVGVIKEGAKTITLTVPFGTDVTALVPTIVSTGASISPASGIAQDFSSPVNYTVTAEDTSIQAYVVTVTVVAPVIATTSTIANGAAAPTVTVTGINFKSGIGTSDLTVGLGTTGLTLDSVSFVIATEITVAFTGTAAAGEVTIQAKTSAFDPASGSASNTLTITVPAAVIDIAAIPGVAAPVTGATPVTTITAIAQYTGTVTWDTADDPFQGDTAYKATITLTAKAGFTLTGVAENFFTVDGATTVTNAANSGVVTAVFPETVLNVGDSYGGGIVAYILQSGDPGYVTGEQHGLIAATANQSGGIQWYNGNYVVTGATGTAIGTGLANTDLIITEQDATATDYAAGLARAYAGGGYNDWFLPSKDELDKLYLNKVAIGGFTSNDYWSSSENNKKRAWKQNFNNGNQKKNNKNNNKRVRAVRSF